MKKIKILLLTLCVVFSVQCRNTFFTDDITFTFPEWPPEKDDYPELAFWKITICSNNQTVVKTCSPETKELDFTISKNSLFCITVLPVTYNEKFTCSFFYCAGAVYPFMKTHNDVIPITWKQGFTSDVIQTLYRGSTSGIRKEAFLMSFNWTKFIDTIKYKEDFNPWLCDKTKIVTAIAGKSFNVNLFNQKNFIIKADSISPQRILSPYIPENQRIIETNSLCVSMLKQNFFSSQNLCIIINGDSDKNYSADYIFMPIYIEDL